MKNNWPIKKLGEIASLKDGNWIESKDQSDSGIRLIQTGNIGAGEYISKADRARFISEETFAKLKCTEIFSGDVLISRLPEPVGRACIIPEINSRMITAVDCTIFRATKEILPRYFLYYSTSKEYFDHVSNYLTGSSRQRISRGNLEKVKLPVPPLEIQKKIVERLDAIRKAQELISLQVSKTDELFESIKEILIKPQDRWEEYSLDEIGEFRRGPFGGSLKKEIFIPNGFKVYEQKNAIKADLNIGNYFITEEKYKEMLDFAIQENDLITSCSGTLGKVIQVPPNFKPGIINQALLKITPDQSKILPEYYKLILENSHLRSQIFGTAIGSSIQNVMPLKNIKKIKVKIPSLDEQKEIVTKISAIQDYNKSLQKQKSLLQELFDSVLHKSISGELD